MKRHVVAAALCAVVGISAAACSDHQGSGSPAPSASSSPAAALDPQALQMCASLAKARQHREAGETASANIETDQAVLDAGKSEVQELVAIAGRMQGPDDGDKLAPLLRDWCVKHGVTV